MVNYMKQVDMALVNGKVITMDPRFPIAESVAVRGEHILAIGTTREIEKSIGPNTHILDLQGKTVVPGFIESHCHPSIGGPGLVYELIVQEAGSIDEIVHMIETKARTLPKGKWIVARRYDDQRLKEKRHPTRWELDRATTDHPIMLRRMDYCLSVVNSMALKLTGITQNTPDPQGGIIDRDIQTNAPNGVLRNEAQAAVRKLVPPYRISEIKNGIRAASMELARYGITSFVDTNVTGDSFAAYQELASEGRLPLRAGVLIPWFAKSGHPGYAEELKALGIKAGFGNNRLRIIGTKFAVDGSMSIRTAALLEPYCGEPDNYGVIAISPENLNKGITDAHVAGLRPCVHAIGDKGIEMILDAMEAASKVKPVTPARLRIEKCTIPTKDQLIRIKQLGIIPSALTGFLYELGPAHLSAVGPERIKRYFPHRTYMDMGIKSTIGSDWSVTSPNVFQHIYGAVVRKAYTGEVIGGEQAVSLMEALELYTINGAYSSFEEEIKGSIESGKLADMAILDRDILDIEKEMIKEVTVETTIVGGEIVYSQ
jgi:predicted amidohydrolase YtcJ